METVHNTRMSNRIVGVVLGIALIGVSFVLAYFLLQRDNFTTGFVITFVGTLLFGILILYGTLRPTSVALTNDALEVRQGSKAKQRYPYDQMGHVRMVARREIHRNDRTKIPTDGRVQMRLTRARFRLYPELQIEGDFRVPYILQLDYTGHFVTRENEKLSIKFSKKAQYDTQAILADLLARLPSGIEVDPAVREYAETSTVADVTILPEESPDVLGMLRG